MGGGDGGGEGGGGNGGEVMVGEEEGTEEGTAAEAEEEEAMVVAMVEEKEVVEKEVVVEKAAAENNFIPSACGASASVRHSPSQALEAVMVGEEDLVVDSEEAKAAAVTEEVASSGRRCWPRRRWNDCL